MVKGGHPMIGASKILTVSYGTFSCTLEGFDDPFNTMRAIAEYFRDLAAEDRYFGAEPPTPDAAMLLKIAEREVQRRVEAKIQDNGVVLRTGDAMQSGAFTPAEPPQAPAAQAYPTQTAPLSDTVAKAIPTPISAPIPEGVAAKLLRIRAAVTNAELAVTREESPTAFAPTQPILTEYTEDQHADDSEGDDAFAATFEDQAFDAGPVDAEVWVQADNTAEIRNLAEVAVEAQALPDRSADVSDAAGHAQDAELPPEIDLSALADRIAESAADAPVSEAVHNTESGDDADLAGRLDAEAVFDHAVDSDFDMATLEADARDDAMADADYAISPDDLADLQALDAAPDAAPDTTLEEAVLAESPKPETDDYDEDYVAQVENAESIAVETSLNDAFADIEDTAEQALDAPSDPVLDEIDSAYAPLDEPVRGPSEKALRARARVIKVRREDAVAADTIPAEASAEVSAMLAADKEDALRRELRALQIDTDTPNPNDVDDETGTEDDARKRLDATGEEAVSRLIEQTNEAMAVPENRRRLSAIAHLKAAVAATVADRFSKGTAVPKEAEIARLDPYREDLARVVRPQHPTGNDDVIATPRPAPLVLVSAQRIDRPRTAPGESTTPLASVPNAPVRPRRVTSAQAAIVPAIEIDDEDEDIDIGYVFSDARGFAEFSERLGANSLSEILEAAAAYSVCIEGRPYFSRPQLMGQIGALSADSEFTREDGLRTFGALLREGRIQKIKRGQFVLTESSHYLAEARKIAG